MNNLMTFLNALHLQKTSAMTLIETMIATAISGIIVFQTFGIVLNSEKMDREVKSKFAFTQTAADLLLSIDKDNFLNQVYANNTTLNRCKTALSNCPRSGTNFQPIPVTITKRRGNTTTVVANSPANPAYYDQFGVLIGSNLSNKNRYFSISAQAEPKCAGTAPGACAANLSPEAMLFILTVREKDANGRWQLRRTFEIYDSIRTKLDAKLATQACGFTMELDPNSGKYQRINRYAQGFSRGQLNCSWSEPAANIPTMKGATGAVGLRGNDGSQGKSACILDHTFGGVEYCGSASGASSFCATKAAEEDKYR